MTVNALEYDCAVKRRRILDMCEFGRSNSGFIDSCRFCSKQILRKGQSRPRICLDCEKKKATPIHDLCKDCRDPIIRSNVRKARICPKCKKRRERAKNESAYAVGYTNRLTLSSTSARIYAVNSWLSELVQYHQQLDPGVSMYTVFSIATSPATPTEGRPSELSSVQKIPTENFNTPEDIVECLVQRQRHKRSGGLAELRSEEHQAPILIPQVNPFEIRNVSLEQLKQENEALGVAMNCKTQKTPHLKQEIAIKKEPDDYEHNQLARRPDTSLLHKFKAMQSEFENLPGSFTTSLEEYQNTNDHLQSVVCSLRDLIPDDWSESTQSQESPYYEFPAIEKLVVAALSEPTSASKPTPYLLSLHVPSASELQCMKKATQTDLEENESSANNLLPQLNSEIIETLDIPTSDVRAHNRCSSSLSSNAFEDAAPTCNAAFS